MSDVSDGSHEILNSYDFVGFSDNKVKSPRYSYVKNIMIVRSCSF